MSKMWLVTTAKPGPILPDLNFESSSSGKVTLDFEPDPAKTFNRGYTSLRSAPVRPPSTLVSQSVLLPKS
jgi:hypothetical protein